MQIKINGKIKDIKDDTLLSDFLRQNGIVDQRSVVVVINENIIKKDDFDSVKIAKNDEIEILRFVSGG
ncbi:MAG: sulfur carrier protein ThiS [Epsilonproteobacteria bacterium]|nr:sulfur carrier protein ThiS [Campylobacterota bacterium]